MNLVPDIRTLLAVDVIASAQNPGYHRDRLWGALNGMLVGAFTGSGIRPDEVTHVEPGGDGALYTLPSTRLGTVSDLTERLDQLAAEHNRWSKPTLRLRAAIHLGAVSQAPHYCSAKILLTRLLNASRFKELVNECVQQNMDSAGNSTINSGLIVSGPAFPEVFGGDHTDLVREEQFASIDVTEKEFTDKAWIRVPGVDRRSLTEIADRLPNRSGQGDPIGDTRQQVITQHADTMTDSFQIGFLRGDINLGDSRRGRSIR